MREERSRLRTQVYVLEKEKVQQLSAANVQQERASVSKTRCSVRGNETRSLLISLQSSCAERGGNATPDNAENEDWAAKEKRLQHRIQELTVNLERVVQNAELRNQQSTELVGDLKKANA